MAKDLRWTTQYIIGVDEAGRGPLAGPVAVGVSFVPKLYQKQVFSFLKKAGLNDSKQVKEVTRESLYKTLVQLRKEQKLDWAVTLVPAKIISTKGIVFAVNFGIKMGLQKVLARHPARSGSVGGTKMRDLAIKNYEIPQLRRPTAGSCRMTRNIELEMDGALKIPPGEWKKASVIIKGDSIKPSIMIASILAKVTRDRYMKKISKIYPQYLFEIHKGYGTKKHRDLIKKYGMNKEHRVGWCKY